MSTEYLLAYDIGTTGNKATLVTTEGGIVASASQGYDTRYPHPGWAEQRPADWWDSVVTTTREVLAKANVQSSAVVAIGLSGHMMGCLAVDDKGVPLADALIHADSRSTGEREAIEHRLGGRKVYEMTGQRLDPHYPLTKAMWLKDNRPEILDKARFLLQSKDYIAFRLTGRLGTTDFSDASLTALYDLDAKAWSPELAEAAGINMRLLPEVLPSDAIVGQVSADAAEETGLCEGIPVVAGAGDGACATLGAGVAAPGDAYNYIGGTSWIAAMLDKPDFDPEMRLFTLGAAEFGRYCAVGTIQSAGSSLQWLADEVCREESRMAETDGLDRFDLMNRLARQSAPGAGKLFFLPYLMGERSPIWDPKARGAFLGLTLSHTRADMVRAVFEGVAYALRSVLDVMAERHINVGELRMIGGGAKSDLWIEIMASVFGRPLRVPAHPGESTSLGAALIAGVGVGAFTDYQDAAAHVRTEHGQDPTAEWASRYEALHPLYESLYPALKESYARLAALELPGE